MDTPGPGNVPEYAVSELAGAIRRTLEGAFGRVRVRGEITEMKRYPSGHVYLSLKDADAKIGAPELDVRQRRKYFKNSPESPGAIKSIYLR